MVVESMKGQVIGLISKRMVPFSLRQLTDVEINPRRFRVIVAKRGDILLGAYRRVCQSFVRVNTPDSTRANVTEFDYRYRRRPIFLCELV